MKNKLETLLGQEPNEEEYEPVTIVKKNPISQAYITKSALKKAYAYARLACEVLEESVECYGYLLTPKEAKDRTVRDVYLAPNQEVSSADVKIEGESVIKAGRDIDKMGYKVLGWWHSHADFGTGHSSIDDENMLIVLNEIAPTNLIITYRQTPLIQNNIRVRKRGTDIEIYDTNNPEKKLRINLSTKEFDTKQLGIIKSVIAKIPVRVGFAYSIVVNALGDKPYCEIATKDFCGLCYDGEERSTHAKLRTVDGEELEIDELKISREIKKKIKKPKRIIPSIIEGVESFFDWNPKTNDLTDLDTEKPTIEDDTKEE